MLFLYSQDITQIYCLVDDIIPKKIGKGSVGRPNALSDSEIITIFIWNILVLKQKTWKDLHQFLYLYHRKEFPRLPKYNAFLISCHKAFIPALNLLQQLLVSDSFIKYMDATMLPVCKKSRADSHKVAKTLANFGKNHQGWHYGFKLHASIDTGGRLSAVGFSPANVHEKHFVPLLLGSKTKIAVGDLSYGGKNVKDFIWKTNGAFILTPPFPQHKTKIAAQWQNYLLSQRSKVESVFDYIKEHLHLVSSFPRSVMGYFVHYVMVLLGYQVYKLANISD